MTQIAGQAAQESDKKVYLRSNYQPYPFHIDKTELEFHLAPSYTIVKAKLTVRAKAGRGSEPMVLNGVNLQLRKLSINGALCSPQLYRIEGETLVLINVPDSFVLETEVLIKPKENTSLEGLYMSNLAFFTQCEAEGFRRITYYPDRPDVLSIFEVQLFANSKEFPILLSNGNLKHTERLADDLHSAVWSDPFPKPCYLFALVAGDFYCHEKRVKTSSGQEKLLQIYVRESDANKTDAAMKALEDSIAWDEKRFGLSLDLERYMIVAVSDFNMGAMENKGLNIFNTKYVLASPDVATDADYANVEAVVGHEYFHNWTGNRVTCRDWFQLSLKEGLTVFRDQEFSADMMAVSSPTARALKRIDDVRVLQQVQFAEDQGPMAHPIRPDSYEEISNFYTATVYEKGAEVVRMIHTLLGEEGFMKGMALYVQRHDGKAVACDDFVDAMADANGKDLTQFKRWYEQAGTPIVEMSQQYDAAKATLTLRFKQSNPPVGIEITNQPKKEALHIPILMGLIDAQGKPVNLMLEKDGQVEDTKSSSVLLELTQTEQSFVFHRVPNQVVVSALRNFSAPIKLIQVRTEQQAERELMHIAKYDEDLFNRAEAIFQMSVGVVLAQYQQQADAAVKIDRLCEVFTNVLDHADRDWAMAAEMLTLPTEGLLGDQVKELDPAKMRAARIAVRQALASRLRAKWLDIYTRLQLKQPYQMSADQIAMRAMKHVALGFLCELPESDGGKDAFVLAKAHFEHADNLTERVGALSAMLIQKKPADIAALQDMYEQFKQEALVIDRWFQLQATARQTNVEHIRLLMQHPLFSMTNPNRMRSLLSAFFGGNAAQFHNEQGYRLWEETVVFLNEKNPQVAARIARLLERYRHFEPRLQTLIHASLTRLQARSDLVSDVREIINKALQF